MAGRRNRRLGADGFRLLLVRTAAETGGECREMEASYSGTGAMPPEHLHPRQIERFDVLDGTITAIIDGAERRYGAGETFEVPAGTPHQMHAASPSRVRWEVRPALHTAEFARAPARRRFGGSIVEFLAEFSDEIRTTGA